MMIRTCALVSDVEVELGFNIFRFLRHCERGSEIESRAMRRDACGRWCAD